MLAGYTVFLPDGTEAGRYRIGPVAGIQGLTLQGGPTLSGTRGTDGVQRQDFYSIDSLTLILRVDLKAGLQWKVVSCHN